MRYLPLFLLGAAPGLMAGAPAVPAPQAPPSAVSPAVVPQKPTPFPGGILDVSGRTAYLPGADGTLEALDLLTGDVLWRTAEAQVPLLVVGDRLVAQAGVKRNRLRLLTLDLKRKGEVVAESDPVVFPRWVVTGDAPGHAFEARWRLERSRVVLNWQASAWSEGDRVDTHGEPATRKQAAGTARIDLEVGEVETAPAEKTPEASTPALPRQLQKQAVRWSRTIDRHLLALLLVEKERPKKKEGVSDSQTAGPGGERPPEGGPTRPRRAREFELHMHAWDLDTGEATEPRTVATGRQPAVLPTLDDEYLLVRDGAPRLEEMTPSGAADRLAWTVYSVRAFGVAGVLPFVPGTHSPTLLAGRLYYLVAGPVVGPLDRTNVRPQTLHAYDLTTRKPLWQHPVAGKALHPPGL